MLRDTIEIYNRNLSKIMVLGMILVLPLSFFCYQVMAYIFLQDTTQSPYVFSSFMIVVNFTLLYPPFVKLTRRELNDQEVPTVKELVMEFVQAFGIILIFSFFFFIIGVLGIGLVFIPTVLAVIVTLIFPLFTDIDKISMIFIKVRDILIKENIFLLLDLLVIVCLNLFVLFVVMYFLNNFENNYYVFVILRSVINMAIFPLIYIYLTVKYRGERSGVL